MKMAECVIAKCGIVDQRMLSCVCESIQTSRLRILFGDLCQPANLRCKVAHTHLALKPVLVCMYVITVPLIRPSVLQAAKAAGEQAQAANGGQTPPYPGLDRRIPSIAKLADLEASQQDLPNHQPPGKSQVACAKSSSEPSSPFFPCCIGLSYAT